MQLAFIPRNPQETRSPVLEPGTRAIFCVILYMIHTLIIDLTITTIFFSL